MSDDHLYLNKYRAFFKARDHAKGYEFQHAPTGNVPPPKVSFLDRLRWWTLNRGERLKKIRALRDSRLQDIIRLKQSVSKSDTQP
jgi:hypothetical protein